MNILTPGSPAKPLIPEILWKTWGGGGPLQGFQISKPYGLGTTQQSPPIGASFALASSATFHLPPTFFQTVM